MHVEDEINEDDYEDKWPFNIEKKEAEIQRKKFEEEKQRRLEENKRKEEEIK